MKLLDEITEGELLKVEKEFNEIKQKAFWKYYKKAILDERQKVARHCETDREDVRFFQGEVKMIDVILALPERVVQEFRQKQGSVKK